MSQYIDEAVRWAAGAVGVGARVLDVQQLRSNSGPWLLCIEHGDAIVEAVLKAGPIGMRAEFVCEVAALELAAEHGLPVPKVIAAELEEGQAALLISLLPGSSEIPRVASEVRLRAVGAAAAMLHRIPLEPRPDLPLRMRHMPWIDLAADRRMMQRESTALLDEADARTRELAAPEGNTVFVHGDLWQGNMLWSGHDCVGLIDWEAAGAGHYGVDLGSLRLDAALLFGSTAPDVVLAGWEAESGRAAEQVAYWDLVAGLNTSADMEGFLPTMHDAGRLDLDAATLTDRRDAFLQAALDTLDL